MATSNIVAGAEKVTNGNAIGYKILVIELRDEGVNNETFIATVPCKNGTYRIPVILDNGTTILFCQTPITVSNGTVSTGMGSEGGASTTLYARTSYAAPTILNIYGIK